MTDLEITRLCAEAMGIERKSVCIGWTDSGNQLFGDDRSYNPLHDDAQAMALVKKMGLQIARYFDPCEPEVNGGMVRVFPIGEDMYHYPARASLDGGINRAICECVAKMQAAKK